MGMMVAVVSMNLSFETVTAGIKLRVAVPNESWLLKVDEVTIN